jgi:hypothetical protein
VVGVEHHLGATKPQRGEIRIGVVDAGFEHARVERD